MSRITTHILDTAHGRPAQGVPVVLEKRGASNDWEAIGSGTTDADGRLRTLVADSASLLPGTYRLVFDTARYFQTLRVTAFYPQVVIIFETAESDSHYHVPLLLSPFGYTTYRGS